MQNPSADHNAPLSHMGANAGRADGYPAATWRAWLTATGTLDRLDPVAAEALAAIDPDVAIAVMDLGPVAGTALLEPVIGRCRMAAVPVRGAA